MNFICGPCKAQEHDKCPGGSWCDCHHRSVRESAQLVLERDRELLERLAQ